MSLKKKNKTEIIETEILADYVGKKQIPEYVECSAGKFKTFIQTAKSAKGSKNRRICKGYATTPTIDWVDDCVTLQAMKDAEGQLLEPGTNTMFFNHNTDIPIGKVLKTLTDAKGLFVECLISSAKDVNDYWTKIKEGILSNFSIRFMVKKVEIEKDDKGNVISFNIMKMQLLELSVVGLPMNRDANITEAIGKSMKLLNRRSKKMTLKEKKQAIADAVKELLPEMIGNAVEAKVGEALKGITDSIKSIQDSLKAGAKADDKADGVEKGAKKSELEILAETVKSLVDGLSAEKKAKTDAEAEAKKQADLKAVADAKAKSDADAEKAKKKGKDGEGDKGEGSEQTILEVDALKNSDDVDTVVTVMHLMDNPEKYNKLSKDGKDKVKSLYFKIQQEATAGKK